MNKKIKALTFILVIAAILTVWFVENRKFYVNKYGQYVTVWKQVGGTCFVIPGKYYGILSPSDNYILTGNTNNVDLYWCKQLSNTLIVRCEQNCKIVSENQEEIKIINYDEKIRKFIYGEGTKKFNEINQDASLIQLFIKEGYAMNKNGEKI